MSRAIRTRNLTKKKFARFDYTEEERYEIVSAQSPEELSKAVTARLTHHVSQYISDGPSSGSHSDLINGPFVADGKFHQALMTTLWREVEHELSDLAKQIQQLLLKEEGDGVSIRELAEISGCSQRDISNAIRELPHVVRKKSSADTRVAIAKHKPNP